jgi:hypothetical protein
MTVRKAYVGLLAVSVLWHFSRLLGLPGVDALVGILLMEILDHLMLA